MLLALAAIAMSALLTQGDPIVADTLQACVGTKSLAAPMEKIAQLKASSSPDAWLLACREARQAEQLRRAIVVKALSGEGAPPAGFESTRRYAQLSSNAASPEAAELFLRIARDSAARNSLPRTARDVFAPSITPLGELLLMGLISNAALESDKDNTAWLKATLRSRGWFTISRDGADADVAAWTIVQHSDADRDFQKAAIDMIEPLVEREESGRGRFPYLFDRWAAGVGRPLRFGLQGSCVAKGQWEPLPIADRESVDERRSTFGLGALAQQIETSSRRC